MYEGSVTATTTPARATRPGEAGGGWGAWDAGKRMLFLSTSKAYSLAMHQKNAAQILAGRLIFQTSASKLEMSMVGSVKTDEFSFLKFLHVAM